MVFKGFAKAHNYKGGYEKWVYDTLKEQDERITALEEASENTESENTEPTNTESDNTEPEPNDSESP